MNWNPGTESGRAGTEPGRAGTESGRAGTKKGKKPTIWNIIHGLLIKS